MSMGNSRQDSNGAAAGSVFGDPAVLFQDATGSTTTTDGTTTTSSSSKVLTPPRLL